VPAAARSVSSIEKNAHFAPTRSTVLGPRGLGGAMDSLYRVLGAVGLTRGPREGMSRAPGNAERSGVRLPAAHAKALLEAHNGRAEARSAVADARNAPPEDRSGLAEDRSAVAADHKRLAADRTRLAEDRNVPAAAGNASRRSATLSRIPATPPRVPATPARRPPTLGRQAARHRRMP
jgi:hypothetical protein